MGTARTSPRKSAVSFPSPDSQGRAPCLGGGGGGAGQPANWVPMGRPPGTLPPAVSGRNAHSFLLDTLATPGRAPDVCPQPCLPQTSAPVSPTSSAARTIAACRAAGSATTTTTVGTTPTRRAAVRAAPARGAGALPQETSAPPLGTPLPPPAPAAPGQVATPQGWGAETPPASPHPAPCCVFEFVPFHLISCFSPFPHCPLGAAEVGVSGVPRSHHTPASARSPPIPALCLSPSPFTGRFLNPGACLGGLVPPLPSPHTAPSLACLSQRGRRAPSGPGWSQDGSQGPPRIRWAFWSLCGHSWPSETQQWVALLCPGLQWPLRAECLCPPPATCLILPSPSALLGE